MVFHGIQILRAVAATMVVVFHIGRMIEIKTGANVGSWTNFGPAGVDLFFVISGFIMVHTMPKDFSAGHFLTRRLIRIAPLYWILTFAYVSLVTLSSRRQLPASDILASFAFLPARDDHGLIYPPIQQGWTLVYEMFFYVALACAWRWARNPLGVLAIFFSGLVVAGMLWSGSNPLWLTYTDPVVFEFLLGAFIAALARAEAIRFSPAIAYALVGAGFLLIGAGSFAGHPELRLFYWGAPSALVVAGVVRLESVIPFKRWRAAKAIGDSSYSLYLVHDTILSGLGAALRWMPLAPLFIVALGTSWVAGLLCYRWLEWPMLQRFRRVALVDAAAGGSAWRRAFSRRAVSSPDRASGADSSGV